MVAILLQNPEHMAVDVWYPFRFDARNRKAETDHSSGIERSESLPANLCSSYEQTHGQQFDIFETPDGLLELDGLDKFVLIVQRSDLNHVVWRLARAIPFRRGSLRAEISPSRRARLRRARICAGTSRSFCAAPVQGRSSGIA